MQNVENKYPHCEKKIQDTSALDCHGCIKTTRGVESGDEEYEKRNSVQSYGQLLMNDLVSENTVGIVRSTGESKFNHYKCEDCNKTFTFKIGLEKHKQKRHLAQIRNGSNIDLMEVDSESFHCKDCDETFVSSFQFEKHKLQHFKDSDESTDEEDSGNVQIGRKDNLIESEPSKHSESRNDQAIVQHEREDPEKAKSQAKSDVNICFICNKNFLTVEDLEYHDFCDHRETDDDNPATEYDQLDLLQVSISPTFYVQLLRS